MEPVNYETFHFYPCIMAGIRAAGYGTPTPLQAQSIPLIMQGKDVIGLAETGAEKTAAFVLPVLNRLYSGQRGYTRALVMSPTTEYAKRTSEVIERLGNKAELKCIALTGEMATAQQAKELRAGPDIIVGCPGSILNYLWKGKINLSNIEVLVIDEADQMSGLGLLPDIFNILMCITNKRQTLLFSTTLPENLRRLSRQFMNNPATVQAESKSPGGKEPPSKKQAANTQKPPENPPKPAQQNTRTAVLKNILGKLTTNSVLVYARTINSAERVAQQVVKAGYKVTALQGTLTRHLRPVALEGFSGGMIILLIVTDTASRGIDVSSIFRIINYDTPQSSSKDIHNLGRTGKVDKNGDALTLVTSTDPVNIHALEQLLETTLEGLTLHGI